MKQSSILIIEDDERILRFIQSSLKISGYRIFTANNGRDGVDLASSQHPDLIVLDIGLPVMDGWEVLQELRSFSEVPVIILSARGEDIDRIKGLRMGADDYLGKPFNPDELLARIEAVMRRTVDDAEPLPEVVNVGKAVIDFNQHTIRVGRKKENLTRLEGLLLGYFVRNSGRIMTYEEILSKVWGPEYSNDVQLLRTAVNRIRNKLAGASKNSDIIRNVSRVGYIFTASGR